MSAASFARRGGSKLALLAGLWSALVVGLVIAAPAILQPFMATTVLQFSTILALVSLGQTMVVLGGGAGIDLSLGGNVSLTSVLAMALVRAGVQAALLPLFCIGIGALLGGVNGFLVTRIRLIPLIATLATLFIYGGLAVALTGGLSISGVPAWLTPLGRGAVWAYRSIFLS